MGRRLTQEEVIRRFKEIHGPDKYDYSLVDYVDIKKKVVIICPVHGQFEQDSDSHISGRGCIQCGIGRMKVAQRMSLDEFIAKSVAVHENKYNYSRSEYKNSKTSVCILCPSHGEFNQTPELHMAGYGCPRCGFEANANARRLTLDQFTSKAMEVHGSRYNYSKVEYTNNSTHVAIGCIEHGEFLQSPSHHLFGKGCPKCAIARNSEAGRMTFSDFVAKATGVHSDKYIYDESAFFSGSEKTPIQCKKHGVFMQKPNMHLLGRGCPRCRESHGERRVSRELERAGISYVPQWRHGTCKSISTLPFDFYIPSLKLLIEYDGPQHHGIYWGTRIPDFKKIKKHDAIKTKWAEDNGYRLLRIPYTQFKQIPEIINNLFQGA